MDFRAGIPEKRENGKKTQIQRVDGVFLDYIMRLYVPKILMGDK